MDPMSIFNCKDKSFEVVDAAARSSIENLPDALGEMSDVTLTSPSAGDTLSFDGSNWINSNLVNFKSVDNTNAINIADSTPVEAAPRITIPSDGLYIVVGYAEWAAAESGSRSIRIDNSTGANSDYVTIHSPLNSILRQQIVCIREYTKDAVVSLGCRQNSGASIQITHRKLTVCRLTTAPSH